MKKATTYQRGKTNACCWYYAAQRTFCLLDPVCGFLDDLGDVLRVGHIAGPELGRRPEFFGERVSQLLVHIKDHGIAAPLADIHDTGSP